MPYRDKTRDAWRAVIKQGGKRYTALFPTKKEALEWESETRSQLKKAASRAQSGMDLMTFCAKYLDHAEQYSQKTYGEKKSLCRRILEVWGPETIVDEITPGMAKDFLDKRAANTSANASNRDRKNLMAMWTYGQDFLELNSNPLKKIKKRAHDVTGHYTPPINDVLKVLMVATREEKVLLNSYIQTGARRSEIFRWKWFEDINFDQKQYRLGTRKTRDGSMSYEWFPMSEELYSDLWWWFQNRPVKDSPWVFCVSRRDHPQYGQPHKDYRWFLYRLCERAQVPRFGYHGLRAFFRIGPGRQTQAKRQNHPDPSPPFQCEHHGKIPE